MKTHNLLKLTAIYEQQFNSRWDAYIEERPDIMALNCEDIETARVLLRILTAEEIEGFVKGNNRRKWDILEEHIYRFNYEERLNTPYEEIPK